MPNNIVLDVLTFICIGFALGIFVKDKLFRNKNYILKSDVSEKINEIKKGVDSGMENKDLSNLVDDINRKYGDSGNGD